MNKIKVKLSILSAVVSAITSTNVFAIGQDAYGNATPTQDNTGSNYQDRYFDNGTNPYFQKDTNGNSFFVNPKTGLTNMEVSGVTAGETTSSGDFLEKIYSGNDYNTVVYEGNNVSKDSNSANIVTISTQGNGDPSKNNVVFYKNYASGIHLTNQGSSMFIDSNNVDSAQISNSGDGYMLIKQNSADNAEITNEGANSTIDVIGNAVTGTTITNDSGTINLIENNAGSASVTNSNGIVNIVGNNVSGATISNSGSGTMNVTSCTTAKGCQSESSVNADQSNFINNGTLNVSGDVILTNSSFSNTGTTSVTGNIEFLNTTLQNKGTLNITDGFNFSDGTFENDGTMNISGTGTYSTQINNNNLANIASNSNVTSSSGYENNGTTIVGNDVTYKGNMNNNGNIFIGEAGSTSPIAFNMTGDIINSGNIMLTDGNPTAATTVNITGDLTNTGDFYLTNAFNSTPSAIGNTLNVNGNLNGDGNYYMQTQVANHTGDLINVTGAVNGNNTLFIKDTGADPISTDSLTVVKSGQAGTGSFALNGGTVDVGTYRYGLERQGNNWVLANPNNNGGKQSNNLSTGANAAVGMHSATASMWEEEMGSLMNRMGDLRLDANRTGGVWVRQLSHEIHASPDSSRAYQQQYNGTQVGVDKAFSFDGGVFYLGAMTGLSRSTLDFKEGANGSIKSQTYGLYGTAIFDNGYYLDTVAKYGHMKNKISYNDNAGQKIKGDYTSNALGLSVEGGKRFTFEKTWFIEPQLQLTASHLRGRSYSLSNGMEVKSNSMDLFNGRAGIVAGTKMTYDNVVVEPYVEVSHIQEFSGTGRVVVNNNRLDSDQIGTRQRYGAGVNFNVAKQHNFFINASYENGSKMEQPWGVKAGYQFRF